jgi:hypothetical protein
MELTGLYKDSQLRTSSKVGLLAVGSPNATPSAAARLRTNSVFGDNQPLLKGTNWSACLRSGRWLRPGDFARDKVLSRGVLVFGLFATLVLIVILSVSDTAFLFPSTYSLHGKQCSDMTILCFGDLVYYLAACRRPGRAPLLLALHSAH